jgi:hypothetical protein
MELLGGDMPPLVLALLACRLTSSPNSRDHHEWGSVAAGKPSAATEPFILSLASALGGS